LFAANKFHWKEHEGGAAPPPAELRPLLPPGASPANRREAIRGKNPAGRRPAPVLANSAARTGNLRLGPGPMPVDRWVEALPVPAGRRGDLHFAPSDGGTGVGPGAARRRLMGSIAWRSQKTMWGRRGPTERGSDQGARGREEHSTGSPKPAFGCAMRSPRRRAPASPRRTRHARAPRTRRRQRSS